MVENRAKSTPLSVIEQQHILQEKTHTHTNLYFLSIAQVHEPFTIFTPNCEQIEDLAQLCTAPLHRVTLIAVKVEGIRKKGLTVGSFHKSHLSVTIKTDTPLARSAIVL